jgi:ABC-2 type transport system ATP-binding protein
MDRIKTFQKEGRTILFVSHSPDQVRAICDRVVVLSDGNMIALGTPGEAVRVFRERLLEAGDILSLSEHEPVEEAPVPSAPVAPAPSASVGAMAPVDNRPVRIAEVTVRHPGEGGRPYLLTGEPLTVRVEFDASSATEGVVFVLEIRDGAATMLLRTDTDQLDQHFDVPAGPGALEFTFDSIPFLDGAYDLAIGIQSQLGGVLYDWQEPACRFEVMNPGRAVGFVSIPHHVAMVPLAADTH